MRLNLLPTKPQFFEDFVRLATFIHESTAALASLAADWKPDSPQLQRILDREDECHDAMHDLLVRLTNSFVTPIDREDIHELASCLNGIGDFVHDTAARMRVFQIQEVTPQCVELTRVLEQSAAHLLGAVQALPSFADFTPWRRRMRELEKQGDAIYRNALAALFASGQDALYVIKWKELYENIETAIDRCEDACEVLDGIVIKHA